MSAIAEHDWEASFSELYQRLGPETKDAIVDLLPADWSWEGKRMLDFGSGPGRTLRHFLPEAESAEFWGADIDAASIEQLQAALCPPMHAWRCAGGPPLGLEHGSFDLIWAISVFTHLTDTSLAWLLELHRLLKPEGLLIATYIGRWHSELVAGEPWDPDTVGMNVIGHRQGWNRGTPMVLMSEWWMRAHWGRAFEILEIEPRIHNMSWALMRKRDVELITADLEAAEDDPREYFAVQHNVRQTQAEIEQAQRDHAARIAELRREYEASPSWRLTRPLRRVAHLARRLRARGR